MRVVSCYSMKGGVGKSATAVNVAYWAAKSGLKTLLIDLDPQGASSFYYRTKPAQKEWGGRFFQTYNALLKNIQSTDFDNLDVIPAHLSFRDFDVMLNSVEKRKKRLRKVLKGLGKEYTVIVLDCPPSISHLSEAVFNAADVILVPVIPTTLSERTFDQLNEFFKEFGYSRKRLVPFFSMVQGQKRLHCNTMESMRKRYKRFLNSWIPFSSDVEKMGTKRAPIDAFARKSSANKAFFLLWQEVVEVLRTQ